jgi:hypothetical protein
MTQVRTLGGVIGIAIVQAILLSHLRSQLPSVLTPDQLSAVVTSTANISRLSGPVAELTRQIFGEAVNLEMKTATGFAGAALIASLFVWRKNKVDMHALEDARIALKSGETLASSDDKKKDRSDLEEQGRISVESRS